MPDEPPEIPPPIWEGPGLPPWIMPPPQPVEPPVWAGPGPPPWEPWPETGLDGAPLETDVDGSVSLGLDGDGIEPLSGEDQGEGIEEQPEGSMRGAYVQILWIFEDQYGPLYRGAYRSIVWWHEQLITVRLSDLETSWHAGAPATCWHENDPCTSWHVGAPTKGGRS